MNTVFTGKARDDSRDWATLGGEVMTSVLNSAADMAMARLRG